MYNAITYTKETTFETSVAEYYYLLDLFYSCHKILTNSLYEFVQHEMDYIYSLVHNVLKGCYFNYGHVYYIMLIDAPF